jgi:hypothetical protein
MLHRGKPNQTRPRNKDLNRKGGLWAEVFLVDLAHENEYNL